MYQLQFTLKQHTPIIHFQHDQDGATLRATEVKPKLDRFIIEQLTYKNGQAALDDFKHKTNPKIKANNIWIDNPNFNVSWQNMLIGKNNDKLALDYKIKIITKGSNSFNNLINITLQKKNNDNGEVVKFLKYDNLNTFFGNLMKVEEFENVKPYKKISFYDELDLIFACNNLLLKNEIINKIDKFFFLNNFGTRQSKGFGSFSINIPNEITNYSFRIAHKKQEFNNVFNDIDIFYRSLKSGLNIKKDKGKVDVLYFKSLMFHYAKELNPTEQWDKRTLRHSLFINEWKYKKENDKSSVFYFRTDEDGTVHYNVPKANNRNYYDFRDLLGLSTEQEWKYYRNSKLTKKVIKNDNEIERFKSPITFKPIFDEWKNEWKIYIIITKIPDLYSGSAVTASANGRIENLIIYPHFDLNSFIVFAIMKFDENDLKFGTNFDLNNVNEAITLKKIYNQLKKQLPNE